MGKLVRDKIPDLIRADGRQPTTRVLDEHEYRAALHAKLHEEATELAAATGPAVAEELADLHEVLLAIANLDGIPWAGVESIAHYKRQERGAFTSRFYLQ